MITKAIERAYKVMADRQWDKVYWAIDLHGVCFASTYASGNYAFVNPAAIKALQDISRRPESKVILWSSCHQHEHDAIIDFFRQHAIQVHFFNVNPEVENTTTGNFDLKFYFSVLLDDKAGFDPDTDWDKITQYFHKLDQPKVAA